MNRVHLLPTLWLVCAASSTSAAPPAGFGDHSRRITTTSSVAQDRFDEGVALLSAFHHDEAARVFTLATEADPTCAMCFWGIAMAYGPHINAPMVPPDRLALGHSAAAKAMALAPRVTSAEIALIVAQTRRYPKEPPGEKTAVNRAALDRAYSQAMLAVQQAHPDDADILVWRAEAILTEHPWDQWSAAGKMKTGTSDVLTVLQRALTLQPQHPLANHLLIHALESAPQSKLEPAKQAADRLRTMAPKLGHLLHMPSHIDVRLGAWAQAIQASERAIVVDDAFIDSHPDAELYRTYAMHNRHMLVFAAMMSGQGAMATARATEFNSAIQPAWIEHAPEQVDGFFALTTEGNVRFGRFDALLAQAEPPPQLPFARAMRHYGRSVALAVRGDHERARAERESFERERKRVSAEAKFGANAQRDLLALAALMLEGELLLLQGKLDAARRVLQRAVTREDALRYDEPPDWILPARHVLGVTLLKQGNAQQAAAVYRADLARWPNNIWSLLGLNHALMELNTPDATVTQQLVQAQAKADAAIATSCSCVPTL